jgi:hypothetical protein
VSEREMMARVDETSAETTNAIDQPGRTDDPSGSVEPAGTGDLPETGDGTSIEIDRLFPEDRASSYRESWDEIQARFVDDPRRAVEDADGLVTSVIGELESSFRDRRDKLERSWQAGADSSTEHLRLALQSYRTFFGRLLGA